MNIQNDSELERALREALRRVKPARDFSAEVYSRRRIPYLAVAAALLVTLLVPAGVVQHRTRQKHGQEARDKLLMALRITGSKLEKSRQMVVRELNRRNTL